MRFQLSFEYHAVIFIKSIIWSIDPNINYSQNVFFFSVLPVMEMPLFSLPVLTLTRWISRLTVAPPSALSVSSSPSSHQWTCYFVACPFHPSLAVRLKVPPPARHQDMLWVAIWAAPSQTLPAPLCEWGTFTTKRKKNKRKLCLCSHHRRLWH